MSRTRLARLAAAYVPRSRAGRTLIAVALVDSAGTGCYLAGGTVFFLRVAGLSGGQLAAGLGIAGAAGLVAVVPMGALTDRLGARRMLVALQAWRALWFAALAFASGVVSFTLISACLLIAERAVSPASQAVVAAAVGDADRTRVQATMRSVRNVGFSLGAAATAPVLALHSAAGFRAIILTDAFTFVIVAVLLGRVAMTGPPRTRRAGPRGPLAFTAGFRDLRYLGMSAVNGVLTLHVTLLSVALPLWIVEHTTAPTALIPVLVLINTVGAVVAQVPVTVAAEKPGGDIRAWRGAGVALAACAALLAVSGGHSALLSVSALIAATVCLTAGEVLQAVGGWSLSYRFAPAGRRAEYLAVFDLGFGLQEILGPIAVVALISHGGAAGWLLLTALYVIITLAAVPLVPSASAAPAQGASTGTGAYFGS